jgi:1-acyl-sn-glycerol-3-phosphate acyltransferase
LGSCDEPAAASGLSPDTWRGWPEPEPRRLGLRDWLRVTLRGLPILFLLVLAFPLLLLLRLPEAALCGLKRPVTPHITVAVCRMVCAILGLRRKVKGAPMSAPGAFVSNHVSWLDIFVLNALTPLFFVAKAEVRGWPGIGWLARGTGTVFVERKRGAAKAQTALFRIRLAAGHRLMVFPEGTTTDGLRVQPFKTTLFGAFFSADLPADIAVQPVSLIYHAPPGTPRRFYGWWGDMAIARGILEVLATPRQGAVEVVFHPALPIAEQTGRKALAAAAERAVRAPLEGADLDPEAP